MAKIYEVVETLDGKTFTGRVESAPVAFNDMVQAAGELFAECKAYGLYQADGTAVYIPRENVSALYLRQID